MPHSHKSHESLPPATRGLLLSTWLLLAYTAWARGGTCVSLQAPLPWLAGLILVGVAAAPWFSRGRAGASRPGFRTLLAAPFKDPVFYLGLAFLAFLALQWWNAGRICVMDPQTGLLTYTPPRHAGLPSAITSADAAEMWRWFFPAWALLLALRSPAMSYRAASRFLRAVLVSAALLAAFGIFQFTTGTESIYWIVPLQSRFFASFGYENHAGAFFVLCLGLPLGFAADVFIHLSKRKKQMGALIVLIASAILLLAGASLSLSGMGIAMSWALVVAAMLYGIRQVWFMIGPATRVNLVCGCLALLCVGYFVAAGVGKEILSKEAALIMQQRTEAEVNVRYEQSRAATQIWRENRWFGVGGWGFRYLFSSQIGDEQWKLLALGDTGKANVHNDPLQFLAEFGVVGAGLMALIVACLLFRIARTGWTEIRKPRIMYPLAAVGLTFLHSLIDLPFRSPAILYHWLAILACLPLLARPAKIGRVKDDAEPQEDGERLKAEG